jgi:hypothetical protein
MTAWWASGGTHNYASLRSECRPPHLPIDRSESRGGDGQDSCDSLCGFDSSGGTFAAVVG